jgi:hypothetical protein
VPPATKACVDFAALTARLEAAPFQNKIKTGVFQQTVKPVLICGTYGATEAAPFQNKIKTRVFPPAV